MPRGKNLIPLFHDNPFVFKEDNLGNKFVLLDRDGVINEERKDYVKSLDELVIYDEALDGLKILREEGYRVIVLTNQSPIGRGIISEETLKEIHRAIFKAVEEAGERIERFYFCPHRPEDRCPCRKPRIGMFLAAKEDFGIDLEKTFYVGDKETDVFAARRAGCKSILVGKEPFTCKIQPNFKAKNLYEAVKIILREDAKWKR